MTDKPSLLTEAQRRSGVLLVGTSPNSSNTRTVPYAERYRESTGQYETPVEHLQRAAEDEAERD